jgi:glutaredoxin 3
MTSPPLVTIYTSSTCARCRAAKSFFQKLGISYKEVNLEEDPKLRTEVSDQYNWRTVPMIIIGEEFIGGFHELTELHRDGKLLPKFHHSL